MNKKSIIEKIKELHKDEPYDFPLEYSIFKFDGDDSCEPFLMKLIDWGIHHDIYKVYERKQSIMKISDLEGEENFHLAYVYALHYSEGMEFSLDQFYEVAPEEIVKTIWKRVE